MGHAYRDAWVVDDTVAMTIAVPREKAVQLRALLDEWPGDRREAPVKETRSLLGKSLHLSEVVRPGKFFGRRILNQSGLEPFKAEETDVRFAALSNHRRGVVRLNSEFHADLELGRLIIEMPTGGMVSLG